MINSSARFAAATGGGRKVKNKRKGSMAKLDAPMPGKKASMLPPMLKKPRKARKGE